MNLFIPDKVMRWLGPAVIIAVGAIAIIGNPIGHGAFCDRTQNCLATWVAALSGWAAVAAAYFTITTMNRQQRQNVKIGLMKHFALARRVSQLTRSEMYAGKFFHARNIGDDIERFEFWRATFMQDVAAIIETMDNSVFAEFGAMIREENGRLREQVQRSLASVNSALETHDKLTPMGKHPALMKMAVGSLLHLDVVFREYLQERHAAAYTFLLEWDQDPLLY